MAVLSDRSPRAVELLARKMYEANDPADMPWIRRGWDVRQAWLRKAQRRLDDAGAGRHRRLVRRLWRAIVPLDDPSRRST